MRVARAVAARERLGPVAAQLTIRAPHPSAAKASKLTTCQIKTPDCSDDFDGQVDDPADTKCKNVKDNDERTDPPCGLGAELVLALPILAALRRRRLHG